MRAGAGQRVLFSLVVTGGAWAAWNGVGFALDPATRHRAETAWFIFAAVLLAAGLSLGRRAFETRPDAAGTRGADPPTAPLILITCSLILYAPVLSIGLLSDDFVLLQRAREGALIDRSWDYVRPLPLALWQLVNGLVPTAVVPPVLHTLNATVHGLNAWLVLLCALRLHRPPRVAWSAALLFLAAPFAVETVAWASGVFDLMLTSCVLISAVVMLSDGVSFGVRVGLVAILAVAAAAAKETAIAQPLLLALLIPFVAREHRRAACWSVVAATAVMLSYVCWRVAAGMSGAPLIPASGYAAKEMISRPFGAVGFGIHRQVLEAVPLLGPMVALTWPIIFVAAAWKWQRDPGIFRMVAFGAAWMLVSTLPLLAMFFVSDDLQGSRYLYLGAAMWSIAMATMLAGATGRGRIAENAVLMVLIASAAATVLAHQRPWVRAAEMRDRVVKAMATVTAECDIRDSKGLPDTVAGAYVFRNGFAEAAVLIRPALSSPRAGCGLQWNGSAFEP